MLDDYFRPYCFFIIKQKEKDYDYFTGRFISTSISVGINRLLIAREQSPRKRNKEIDNETNEHGR